MAWLDANILKNCYVQQGFKVYLWLPSVLSFCFGFLYRQWFLSYFGFLLLPLQVITYRHNKKKLSSIPYFLLVWHLLAFFISWWFLWGFFFFLYTPLPHKVLFHLKDLKQIDMLTIMYFPSDLCLSSYDQAFICSGNVWVTIFPLSCDLQMSGYLPFHLLVSSTLRKC